MAGRVAASRDEKLLPEFWKLLEEFSAGSPVEADEAARERYFQLAASLIAALSSLQEDLETRPYRDSQPYLPPNLDLKVDSLPVELRAFADALAMRELVIRRRLEEARSRMVRLKLASNFLQAPKRRQRWFDWRAPDSFVDRLRLEALRLYPDNASEEDRRGWLDDAMSNLDTVDAERLASLILQTRLAGEVIPAEELAELVEAEKYDPNRQPVCNAHRAAPPLVVSIAQGYLALGRATEALALLKERASKTTTSAQHQEQQYAVQVAEAQVIWRMRLASNARSFVSRMTSSSNPQRQALTDLLRTVFEPINDSFKPSIVWPQFTAAGPRYSAEKALEKGERAQLAPGEGSEFFAEAFDSFSGANDSVGALIAAISGAIATIHAGKAGGDSDRESLQRRLQEAYEKIDSSRELPKWHVLIELSADPQQTGLDSFDETTGKSDWGGWAQRLLGCLVWLNDTTDDHRLVEQWRDWLKTQYGDGLPVELDLPVAQPAVEEAVEYSNAWFSLYALLKGFTLSLMGLTLYMLSHSAFIAGAKTGNEVGLYWIVLLGFFLIYPILLGPFEAQGADQSGQKTEGWWRKFKRLLTREQNHPGRFHQLTIKALGIERGFLAGFGFMLMVGVFLFLRWLWNAKVEAAVSAHRTETLIVLLVVAFVTLPLVYRERFKAACQQFFTRHDLHFEADTSTDRLDAATEMDFTVRARQREILFSDPLSDATHLLGRMMSLFLPYAYNPEKQRLEEFDPHILWPEIGEIFRRFIRSYSRKAVEEKGSSRTPGLTAYSAAAEKIPAEVVERLRQAKKSLWFLKSTVALHVAPALAFAPWEAMLTMAINDTEPRSLEDELLFFRAGELLPISSQATALDAWRKPSVAAVGNGRWEFLTRAWGEHKKVGGIMSPSALVCWCLHRTEVWIPFPEGLLPVFVENLSSDLQ